MVNSSSVITKSRYFPPGGKKSVSGYLHYISTREGVEKLSGARTYLDYIAMRPGVEKLKTHGLFDMSSDDIKLSSVEKEVDSHQGNIWDIVISIKREDAERLGFNCAARWRDELRSKTQLIAETYKIPLGDLRWYAAYHDSLEHPHVHMIVYSKDVDKGYLTKPAIDKFKNEITRDIFSQDLISIYEKKDFYREALKDAVYDKLESLEDDKRINVFYPGCPLYDELMKLNGMLRYVPGKMSYGYMPKDVKAEVRNIVQMLEDDPRIGDYYNLWYEQKNLARALYSEDFPPMQRMCDNKEFNPIRNMVIEAAWNMADLPGEEPVEAEITPLQVTEWLFDTVLSFTADRQQSNLNKREYEEHRHSKKELQKMMAQGRKVEGMQMM